MNIVEFWEETGPNNSYVEEPDFSLLYVRKGKKYLPLPDGTRWVEKVLQLATLDAWTQRAGALRRLLERIENETDAEAIYIENIFDKGLAEALVERYSFIVVDHLSPDEGPFCIVKELDR
jgi:hypothetical protein